MNKGLQDFSDNESPTTISKVHLEPDFQGPGTFSWTGSLGYSPIMVWQYANSKDEASEIILSKASCLSKPFITNRLSSYPTDFGVIFLGCFVPNPTLDDFRRILSDPPEQMTEANLGSGLVSCLDG
jgi:hypothetical protein